MMSKKAQFFREYGFPKSKEEQYNPFSWYKKMRYHAPVYFDEKEKIWHIFGYDDVKRVLEDKEVFSSELGPLRGTLIATDPPRHTELRFLVNKAFTPKVLDSWIPRIQQVTSQLLDLVDNESSFDLVSRFSVPLPTTIIAELLGIPVQDRILFKEWSDTLTIGEEDKKPYAMKELGMYFHQMVDEKRTNPQDDIVSTLVHAVENGRKLTIEEVVGFCILLLVAGNETTTNLIVNAVYTFIKYQSFQILKDDIHQLPVAIEEVLRYRSPAQFLNRIVKKETLLQDQLLKPGERVQAWIGSANRDEKQFPSADCFQIYRNPNRHLAFGKGIHFCLGAPLARLEMKIALTELIRRYKHIKLSDKYVLDPISENGFYGLNSLLVEVQ